MEAVVDRFIQLSDFMGVVANTTVISIFQFVIANARSLIYMRKRSGPRHDPCGTPIVLSLAFESVPLTIQNYSGWVGII